ncbi:hypothetical protein EVAR_40257_1 [Eumeta japonica]|uniref:Uncharacterized protein n=1 Tax=Eumeta variegata TaxID=151549 RepID=A0A4C1Y5F9_EUMVA|nr:hypothetical protein EVAR_40257_1 [Eumeta japonica]
MFAEHIGGIFGTRQGRPAPGAVSVVETSRYLASAHDPPDSGQVKLLIRFISWRAGPCTVVINSFQSTLSQTQEGLRANSLGFKGKFYRGFELSCLTTISVTTIRRGRGYVTVSSPHNGGLSRWALRNHIRMVSLTLRCECVRAHLYEMDYVRERQI